MYQKKGAGVRSGLKRSTVTYLKNHMGYSNQEYFCERCGYGTFDKSRFTRHLSRKRPCKPIISQNPLRALRAERGIVEPGAVKKRVLERKTPTCEYCARIFKSAQSKWNHKKRCPGRAAQEAETKRAHDQLLKIDCARERLLKGIDEGNPDLALDKAEAMRIVRDELAQSDGHHGLVGFVRAFLQAGVLRPEDLTRFQAPSGEWLRGYHALVRCWNRNLDTFTLLPAGVHPAGRRAAVFEEAHKDLTSLLDETADASPDGKDLKLYLEHLLDNTQGDDVDATDWQAAHWQARAEAFFTQCIDAPHPETTESSETT